MSWITWLKVLADAQVPSGKIYDIADIVNDVQYRMRGMIQQWLASPTASR